MKIVIATDKFKEALSARQACEAIERGIRGALPDAQVEVVPMADGGDGTAEALIAATGGEWRESMVADPLGRPVRAPWGLLGESKTAIIEMAAASGLSLVPAEHRDPTKTTTYGTGELIRAALDARATRILIGIGGSATTDGGAGAAQALGVSFLKPDGSLFTDPLTGGDLPNIARIDMSGLDPRLARTPIEIACDVDNPLLGPQGAAAVYGPQKGATPAQVELLDQALARLADLIERDLGKNVRDLAGAGAAGGLGAGLVAFTDGQLRRGVQMVMAANGLADRVRGADLVITGEGRLDRQSLMGKVIAGVVEAARSAGVPVIAMVGGLGEGGESAAELLDGCYPITPPEMPLHEALARTAERLESTTQQVVAQMQRRKV